MALLLHRPTISPADSKHCQHRWRMRKCKKGILIMSFAVMYVNNKIYMALVDEIHLVCLKLSLKRNSFLHSWSTAETDARHKVYRTLANTSFPFAYRQKMQVAASITPTQPHLDNNTTTTNNMNNLSRAEKLTPPMDSAGPVSVSPLYPPFPISQQCR